ncbi:MAG: LytR family transcriptional regulator, partial [Bacteroidia bacterium]|nr:LytR family transcriptional regulator [Bacteroidia bacterium]
LKAREVSADSVMLIKIDETAKEFVFSVLPADMKVQADGGDVRLGSLYSLKGIHYMRNKVTAMTGLTIDFFAVVSIPGFTAIIDELGGINMTVPVDMNYVDESQQLTIRLNKGAQTLSGTDAVNMLRYKLYSNGDTSRRAMAVTFARALLRKMTVPAFMTQSAELYSALSKYIETDFTLNDLILYLHLILLYPEFTSTEINYPGTAGSFDSNTYFEPDLSSAISLYRKYR